MLPNILYHTGFEYFFKSMFLKYGKDRRKQLLKNLLTSCFSCFCPWRYDVVL